MDKKSWIVTVEEDPDNPEECILPFPEEMLKLVGWTEGDTITWTEQPDGSWVLTKKE